MNDPSAHHRGKTWPGGLLLLAVAFLVYLPALRAGFIWDDDTSLTANPLIKAADGLFRFWGTTQAPDYWPVTSSALWLEWRLWGMHAIGYHLTNVALHGTEALLWWVILRRLRLPGAYWAAMVFAVHPVNVESVAWITQQKNLWAMLFYLASIFWYIKTGRPSPTPVVRRNPEGEGGPSVAGSLTNRFYWLSLAAFSLAMLSKGSVAMLPVVLVGLIAWYRRPTRRDAVWLMPYFLVAAILSLVDVWFQRHGAAVVIRAVSPLDRLLGAGAAVWFYLIKALWPVHLVFVYPSWGLRADEFRWWLPLLAASVLTVWLWRGRHRFLLFAWGYYCAMLVPVLGFTDVYFMKYSLVADHYQHLAIMGVIAPAVAAWGPTSPAGRGLRRASRRITAIAVICVLGILTWRQCGIYRDSETLYRSILAQNPRSWLAHLNWGDLLFEKGRADEAASQYRMALRDAPDNADLHFNFGKLLLQQGRTAEAESQFRETARIAPADEEAHDNLGIALGTEGRTAEAVVEFESAVRLQPNNAKAHNNLGVALRALGRDAEARVQFAEAARLGGGR